MIPRRRANVKGDQTAEREQLFFSLTAAAPNQSVFIILCRSNVKYIYIEHEQRQSDTIRTKGGDRMTREQRQKLHSLAYWIAESAYTRERYPEDTDTLNRAEKTIKALFDELDREEQLNILNELSKPNLTDHEMQAVQYLRDNNATLNDVIHYFQQKAVEDYISANTVQKTYSVDDYSDDELFIADLKMKYPDMDDAELEADLILAKSNEELFKKKADIIRNNYKAIEDKQIQDAKAAEEQSYQDFKASLSNALQNFEEISLDYTDPSSDSLAIEDSEREAISSYILSVDENGVSQFAKDLQDPQKLVNFGYS